MLSVRGLQAGYGNAPVLFDVNLDIAPGEVVTLLGRNGMGKTTTVRAIMGLNPPRGGEVTFRGARISGLPPEVIAKAMDARGRDWLRSALPAADTGLRGGEP